MGPPPLVQRCTKISILSTRSDCQVIERQWNATGTAAPSSPFGSLSLPLRLPPTRESAAWCLGPSFAASVDSPRERGLVLRGGLAPVGDCRGAERPSVQRLALAEGAGVSGRSPLGPGPLRVGQGPAAVVFADTP
jgi:hypothetical protein